DRPDRPEVAEAAAAGHPGHEPDPGQQRGQHGPADEAGGDRGVRPALEAGLVPLLAQKIAAPTSASTISLPEPGRSLTPVRGHEPDQGGASCGGGGPNPAPRERAPRSTGRSRVSWASSP